MLYKAKGFTLVELIVVITIVWILSTVGFVSYSGYLAWARDSNRFSQLTKLSDSLQVYAATKSLPLPDDYIEISASGTVIAYQGYAGVDVLETIDYTNGGKDPKDDSYYTYYLTKNRKSMQLLAFMEEQGSVAQNASLNSLLTGEMRPQAYGANYENRFPKAYGSKLWVLTSADEDTLHTPVQELSGVTSIDIATTSENLNAYFWNADIRTGSGLLLYGLMSPKLWGKAPSECREWFIAVPWNLEFHPKWFCVAQYEMSYIEATTPNSTEGGTDWNTYAYDSTKTPVSKAWLYPVVNLTQGEAISSCASIWAHLITNDEWMTITRSIEMRDENWSGWSRGNGILYNGVSNDTTLWCNAKGWNTESRTYATKTGAGETACNLKRRHILSNGKIIWDLSWNVYEHVNKANTEDGTGYATGTNPNILAANNAWWEWNAASLSDKASYGPLLSDTASTSGVGRVYQANGTIFVRGASANYGSYAGLFALGLFASSLSEYGDVGFRCAE